MSGAYTPSEAWAIERAQITQRYSKTIPPWERSEVVEVEPAGSFLKRAAVVVGVLLLLTAMTTYRPALRALDHVGYSEARL